MTTYISAANVIHETDRVGTGGYVTKCRVVVVKAHATPAKVFFDHKGPRSTKKWGAVCRLCFGDGK